MHKIQNICGVVVLYANKLPSSHAKYTIIINLANNSITIFILKAVLECVKYKIFVGWLYFYLVNVWADPKHRD